MVIRRLLPPVVLIALLAAIGATVSQARPPDPNPDTSAAAPSAPAGPSVPADMPNQAPVNTSPPTISGGTLVGQTLTASPGTWTGAQPITFSYQWQSCDGNGANCSSISGATKTTYVLQSRDAGHTMRAVVTAKNRKGKSSATSAPTGPVTAAASPPVNTAPPAIAGTPQSGQTLSATSGTWSGSAPINYAYQWLRCDTAGANCAPIGGATASSYTAQDGDVGSTLEVSVTATNSAGGATATSPATAPVQAAPASCSGIVVVPGSDLQSLVNANPTGTNFCLQAGTYSLSAGILTKSYDSFVGQAGTVLDGRSSTANAFYGYGGDNGQVHVTVQNMVFQHFTGAAVALGWYAQVLDNELRDNQIGVTLNSYSTLDGNDIHDNYQYGLNGGPGSNILIENNEIAHNNTSNYCGGACSGDASGSKIVGSTAGTYGLTWRNNYVHDNIGAGIWSDGNVHGAVYDGNTIVNNTEEGILHEVSWDAVISNNIVTDNDAIALGLSCWHGAQIDINTSQNVEIYGNTIKGDNGANGICAISADRSETAPYPQAVANLNVHDNTVYMSGSASTGLVVTSDPTKAALAVGDQYVDNTYYVSDTSAGYWEWQTSANQLNWSGWRSARQDNPGSTALWK